MGALWSLGWQLGVLRVAMWGDGGSGCDGNPVGVPWGFQVALGATLGGRVAFWVVPMSFAGEEFRLKLATLFTDLW